MSRPPWPLASLIARQRPLLVVLILLTTGAWALTVQQSRTMDMPMGVVFRGGAETTAEPVGTVVGGDTFAPSSTSTMAGMDGMPALSKEAPAEASIGMLASSGMAAMDNGGWSWDGIATFLVAWGVMMAAMMLPATAPMLALYQTMTSGRRHRGHAFVPTWVFAAGYMLVWLVSGVVTWITVQGLSDVASQMGSADRATWAPLSLGAVLIVAGIYQFTPLKTICLRHCQSPVGFVMSHWRDGYRGALRMGLTHGGYCLGCCWALTAVLVAAGVMSLAWMLLLTLIVFAERVFPLGPKAPRAIGAAFLILGLGVAMGAVTMPWIA